MVISNIFSQSQLSYDQINLLKRYQCERVDALKRDMQNEFKEKMNENKFEVSSLQTRLSFRIENMSCKNVSIFYMFYLLQHSEKI